MVLTFNLGRTCTVREFWGFAVTADDCELVLRWDTPRDARELLADIARYLQRDTTVLS